MFVLGPPISYQYSESKAKELGVSSGPHFADPAFTPLTQAGSEPVDLSKLSLEEKLERIEKQTQQNHDLWLAEGERKGLLNRREFAEQGLSGFRANRLELSERETVGIEKIAEITGYSETTVQSFYALSVVTGLSGGIDEFVNNMTTEEEITYGNLKRTINSTDRARILSTLA